LLESHCSGRSFACLAASHNAQSCCSSLTWFVMTNLNERQHRSRLDFFSYMVLTVSRGTGKLWGTSLCVLWWLKEKYDGMSWTPGSTGTSKHIFLIHDVWWEREMTERGGRGERKTEDR
jgi:hypothetical protein